MWSVAAMNRSPEVVERFYGIQRRFYAGENVADDLTDILAEGVIWHVPGRSAIAGEYRGTSEVLAYFAKRRDIADQTFRVTPRGQLAKGERVVHFADGEAVIDGQVRCWRTVGIFRVSQDRIEECWLLPFDQYEFDEIWSPR
jgi:limonene-1,2-epoxide hydrolase